MMILQLRIWVLIPLKTIVHEEPVIPLRGTASPNQFVVLDVIEEDGADQSSTLDALNIDTTVPIQSNKTKSIIPPSDRLTRSKAKLSNASSTVSHGS